MKKYAHIQTGSKREEAEPIYTNGRVYFNFTGDICNKSTNESYTLLILTMCDYSSHTQNPIILMPYVILNSAFSSISCIITYNIEFAFFFSFFHPYFPAFNAAHTQM